jgi:hypothetical protein
VRARVCVSVPAVSEVAANEDDPMSISPNPSVMEPASRGPVPVMAVFTAVEVVTTGSPPTVKVLHRKKYVVHRFMRVNFLFVNFVRIHAYGSSYCVHVRCTHPHELDRVPGVMPSEQASSPSTKCIVFASASGEE